MSSLIFSQAKSIRKAAKKAALEASVQVGPEDAKETYILTYQQNVQAAINDFRETLYIAQELHTIYEEVVQKTNQWYFITVRPDEKLIDFDGFYGVVNKFVQRKCIEEFTLSFEQKGINDNELGNGFHMHIVVKPKAGSWRSKGEVLRDTKSTFACCAAANCIEVIPTKKPEEIINGYMIEYESKDGHKEVTKEADARWRSIRGLSPTYVSSPLPVLEMVPELSLSSP